MVDPFHLKADGFAEHKPLQIVPCILAVVLALLAGGVNVGEANFQPCPVLRLDGKGVAIRDLRDGPVIDTASFSRGDGRGWDYEVADDGTLGAKLLPEVSREDIKRLIAEMGAKGLSKSTMRLAVAPIRGSITTPLTMGIRSRIPPPESDASSRTSRTSGSRSSR